MTGTPAVSVVVPSHDRPVRLRWLLNALQEQTLDTESFEVLVVHDSRGPETDALLAEHPLSEAGVVRSLHHAPGLAGPAAKRNAGWRAARAPLVAFTDDDCRPPPEWLERLLGAASRLPGAIVQGATSPDPDEAGLLIAAGFHRTQEVSPPAPWGQTCNIAYPRPLLERLGGFDEAVPVASGEDTDLLLRALRAGAPYLGAPAARTYHAVEPLGLLARIRDAARWRHLARVARRHPEHRRDLFLGVFQKPSHARLALCLAGLALSRRRRAWLLLCLPWIVLRMPRYGSGWRGRGRALVELGGRFLLDGAEVSVLAAGSVRYRTLVL